MQQREVNIVEKLNGSHTQRSRVSIQDAAMDLGSLVPLQMTGFGNSRGQVVALNRQRQSRHKDSNREQNWNGNQVAFHRDLWCVMVLAEG